MEVTTMLVWVLLTTARVHGGSGSVSYSPPLITQASCEALKATVIAKHKALRTDSSIDYDCIQLQMAVPDSNARWEPRRSNNR